MKAIFNGLIIASVTATMAIAAPVASAKSYGYRGNDIAKYNRLVGKFAKKNCASLAKEHAKAQQLSGKKAKGTGAQITAGVLNNRGTTKGGLLVQLTGDVIKDAAIRRDASHAVMRAKGC